MKLIKPLCILLSCVFSFPIRADNGFCDIKNTSFGPGEKVTYKVFYSLGANIGAGEATFTTTLETFNRRPVYHVVGTGSTYSFYDNFFRVRDRYESFIDTTTMQPLRFIRNIEEGSYRKHEEVTFNKSTNTAITNSGVFKIPACIQDVVSAIFYARNIDFSKYKPGDKIPFSMFLDKEVFEMYIRYIGKETVKTKYGKFRAIKFKPLLVKGTIFEGGEKMTVWVSDDANHIPVRIESPITVGSVKVDMIERRNLRHPLSSLIEVR
jgi:hypothetical protein